MLTVGKFGLLICLISKGSSAELSTASLNVGHYLVNESTVSAGGGEEDAIRNSITTLIKHKRPDILLLQKLPHTSSNSEHSIDLVDVADELIDKFGFCSVVTPFCSSDKSYSNISSYDPAYFELKATQLRSLNPQSSQLEGDSVFLMRLQYKTTQQYLWVINWESNPVYQQQLDTLREELLTSNPKDQIITSGDINPFATGVGYKVYDAGS